jgi:hypothetical protein
VFFFDPGANAVDAINQFKAALGTACSQGMPERLFHDFRRMAARNLIRAGVAEPIEVDRPTDCGDLPPLRHLWTRRCLMTGVDKLNCLLSLEHRRPVREAGTLTVAALFSAVGITENVTVNVTVRAKTANPND